MLFHTTFRPRPGLTNESQKLALRLWAEWTPPKGFEIKSFLVTPGGTGFVVSEAETAEAVYEACAPWSGVIFDYEVVPVLEVQKALPILNAAIAKRG